MKKNIVIAILSVMVIALVGTIICMSLKMEEDKKEKQSSNQKPENQEQINEQVQNQKKREYIRYTSTELKYDKDKSNGIGIKIEVKDGKLVETSTKGLTFSGIKEKVKYFTYDIDSGGYIGFLALTEDNKVYVAFYDYAGTYGTSNQKNIVFQEIKTNEKVKDITEYVCQGNCEGIYLGVVLENGKIYPIEMDYNNHYSIGTTDYSMYKDRFLWIMIYTDDTISIVTDSEKVKYNNKDILAKKIYESGGTYYILDKADNMYRLDIDTSDMEHFKVEKVSLVGNSQVFSIEENKDNIKVTFKDGTNETLKANISDYGVYKNLE